MNKNVNRKFPAPDCLHVTWAAKYLDCTVEDIIRYGAKGDIDLLVNFDECDKPVYGLVTDYTGQNPDNNWLIMLSGGLACYGEAEPTNEPDVVTVHITVENEHLFRFKMNADSGLGVHRFRTPQCTYSDVR